VARYSALFVASNSSYILAIMLPSTTFLLPLLLCAVGIHCQIPRDRDDITTAIGQISAQSATADALVYGYPLTQFMMLGVPVVYVAGVNNFFHRRRLSTSEDGQVVRPNEDTLYSSMIYDLSHGDVIINFPEMADDQFHLMTYYDPYGNVLASIGSGYTDEAGQYRLRLRTQETQVGLDNTTSEYAGFINSPSVYGTILMRLVLNSTNIDLLHTYQNATTSENTTSTTAVEAPYYLDIIQGLQTKVNESQAAPSTTETILGLLGIFAPLAAPISATAFTFVEAMLSSAGVGNGTYTPPAGVDLAAANATALDTMANCLYPEGEMTKFANDWAMIAVDNISPDFGTHYAIRAVVAESGYIITRSPNTIYPVWTNVSAGELTGYNGLGGSVVNLAEGEALLYDFVGGQPPLQTPGFWSMTMYNAEGFLVDNEEGVYRLGDRDNLTYSDGTPIYAPPRSSTPDPRPFQILVQPADVVPPANWTSNWLPSPTDGSDFTAWLRFYGTKTELVQGNWTFPTVTKIKAITDSTSATGENGTVAEGSYSGANAASGMMSSTALSVVMCIAAILVGAAV
jgi:hypothetical protein